MAKISIHMGIIPKLGHICVTLQNGHNSSIMNTWEVFHGTHEIKGIFLVCREIIELYIFLVDFFSPILNTLFTFD